MDDRAGEALATTAGPAMRDRLPTVVPPDVEPFPVDWYSRPTLAVARDLLGSIFVRMDDGGILAGRIVEVEAYHGRLDEASHAFRGPTLRNAMMFRGGGILYVYFTYGMHYCMNVVTEAEGTGAAVLIRGIEPLAGIERMRRLRGRDVPPGELTNGPAKCCQAFGVDRAQNGASLRGPELMILPDQPVPDARVIRSPRIGIRRSTDLPWRFSIRDHPFVSRPRP
jgi:DNA-3-methyladenine glycosylase